MASASSDNIKVAILDNFHSEILPSEQYGNYYLQGISIAADSALKDNHIHVVYKNFTYGTNPLGILQSLSAIKEWHPDLIIGPRSSNQFLLLKNQLNNILVISPYATASNSRSEMTH